MLKLYLIYHYYYDFDIINKKRVNMFLGDCPYCNDGKIEIRKKDVRGKKINLYACSNAQWSISLDEECFELTEDSTCSFKIWQNALGRYGKWFSNKDIKELLLNEELEVTLNTKKYKDKIEYTKYVILDKEFGITVLWD